VRVLFGTENKREEAEKRAEQRFREPRDNALDQGRIKLKGSYADLIEHNLD
jgi:hypothetical protein